MKKYNWSALVVMLARILILSYGGVAFLQWVHSVTSDAVDGDLPPLLHWLRDGTMALPLIAAAVLLTRRLTGPEKLVSGAALFSVVMGVGSFVHETVPGFAHAGHDDGATISTFSLIQHMAFIMALAGLYYVFAETLFNGVMSTADQEPSVRKNPSPTWGKTRVSRWAVRAVVPAVALAGVLPALVFGPTERAAAQTSFPDQTIHPKGSLYMITEALPDGSMAYVAPDFGANGVRPTIEMTEGETLNITLKNQLSDDVSLHVHGVLYSQDSDGTRHSGSFVKAGQTRVYQWRAGRGTAGYWHYHDHVLGDDEGTTGILNGLYGGLIVRRPGDPKPAHTFVIVGQDKTLNGRIYPDTPTYVAKQGELVEWLVISHGNRVHTFHLHGHRWLNPYRQTDPSPSNPDNVGSGYEDNHILAPGQSFGFLVIAGDGVGPGMWMYHCHFQDHAASMKGFFKVLTPDGKDAQAGTAVADTRFFKETGHTVSGRFLDYWNANGGLAQQGYPISDPFMERSDLDGKTYQVQYFERSVFEAHPENAAPYDVLLSQLGTFRYKQKYPGGK